MTARLTPDERRTLSDLNKLSEALRVFGEETNLTHPIRHMLTFLEIAKADLGDEQWVPGHKGIPLSDLRKRAQAESASITRIVQELGLYNRRGEPGYRLVEPTQLPPPHGALRPVILTPKGRRLAAKLAAVLER